MAGTDRGTRTDAPAPGGAPADAATPSASAADRPPPPPLPDPATGTDPGAGRRRPPAEPGPGAGHRRPPAEPRPGAGRDPDPATGHVPDPAPPDDRIASLFEAAPGLLRIGAGAWWRTASWTAGTSLGIGSRILRAATFGESAADLLHDAEAEVRAHARGILGIDAEDDAETTPASRQAATETDDASPSLRDRGAELLNRSADVTYEQGAHPAYARILGELAPDEGRILRLLATEGSQPAVDVRTGRPLNVGSQLIAPGLTMVGAEAGCRYVERVPAYLNNLFRLGLIWFSREELDDLPRYQVLEAQPDVLAAVRQAGRARTVRRSIGLTPFGEDFCETCLPLHTAEIDALPAEGPAGPG